MAAPGTRGIHNLPTPATLTNILPFPAVTWLNRLYDALNAQTSTSGTTIINITINNGIPGPPGTPGIPGAPGAGIGPVRPRLVLYGSESIPGAIAQDTPFFYQGAIERMTVPRVHLFPLLGDTTVIADEDGSTLVRPGLPPLQFDENVQGIDALSFPALPGGVEYGGQYYWGTDYLGVRRPFAWGSSSMPPIGPFVANELLYGAASGSGGINQSASLTYSDTAHSLAVSSAATSGNLGSFIQVLNTQTSTASLATYTARARNGTVFAMLQADGFGTGILATAGALVGTSTAHRFSIVTSNTERIQVAPTGEVGIGTSAGGAKLVVMGSAGEISSQFIYNSGATNTGIQLVSEVIAQSTANVTATASYASAQRFSFVDAANILNPLGEFIFYRNAADDSGYFALDVWDSGVAINALNSYGAGLIQIPGLNTNELVYTNSQRELASTTAAGFGLVSGDGTSPQVAFWNSSSTIDGDAGFTYAAAGCVGIGAALSASHVLLATNDATRKFGIESRGVSTTSDNWGVRALSTAATSGINYGFWTSMTGGAGNRGLMITGTTAAADNFAIYCDAAAKVYILGKTGINNTVPSYQLDVIGDIGVRDGAGVIARFDCVSSVGNVGTNSNHAFHLLTNNTSRWNITTAGHLLSSSGGSYDIGDSGLSNAARNIYATARMLAGTDHDANRHHRTQNSGVSGTSTGFATSSPNPAFTANSSDNGGQFTITAAAGIDVVNDQTVTVTFDNDFDVGAWPVVNGWATHSGAIVDVIKIAITSVSSASFTFTCFGLHLYIAAGDVYHFNYNVEGTY